MNDPNTLKGKPRQDLGIGKAIRELLKSVGPLTPQQLRALIPDPIVDGQPRKLESRDICRSLNSMAGGSRVGVEGPLVERQADGTYKFLRDPQPIGRPKAKAIRIVPAADSVPHKGALPGRGFTGNASAPAPTLPDTDAWLAANRNKPRKRGEQPAFEVLPTTGPRAVSEAARLRKIHA